MNFNIKKLLKKKKNVEHLLNTKINLGTNILMKQKIFSLL